MKNTIQAVIESATRLAACTETDLAEMPEGHHFWQGDVSIQRLDAVPSELTALTPSLWPARLQLVPGIGIGSQHQVETAHLSAIHQRTGDELTGPVIVTGPKGTIIEHPKHGAVKLRPSTVYSIGYQRAYSPLGLLRRQAD